MTFYTIKPIAEKQKGSSRLDDRTGQDRLGRSSPLAELGKNRRLQRLAALSDMEASLEGAVYTDWGASPAKPRRPAPERPHPSAAPRHAHTNHQPPRISLTDCCRAQE